MSLILKTYLCQALNPSKFNENFLKEKYQSLQVYAIIPKIQNTQ